MTKAATETTTALQTRLIKALGHPLRQRILALLNQRESSPSALAEAIGQPIGKVAYHVKILLDYQAIELVRTRPVRGAVEHFYKATIGPRIGAQHWAELPPSVRRSLFDGTMQEIWEHAADGAERAAFNAPDAHVSATRLDLDEQGATDVARVISEALERVQEIQAEVAARGAGAETTATELAVIHYGLGRLDT